MNKKVVLFFPNPFSGIRLYQGPPLGLLGISRMLDKEGYDIKIIHPITHSNFTGSALKECENAVCFGISSMTGYQIHEGLNVAKEVKKIFPKLPIIWGGWHPSILPLETIKSDYVDIVVKGQGERTFTELVHCLSEGKKIDDIPGITYKKDGTVFDNPVRAPESLDNFPPLPYHLIDVEKFISNTDYGSRSLNYYTSYGCPHRCSFCVEEVINKRHWVSLSPENTYKELKDLKDKYGIDSVSIIDSNFFVNKERVRKMTELMTQNKLNIKWGSVNGRTSTLVKYEDELWKLMKESGLNSVLIGAESADQTTLDYMNKDIQSEDVYTLAEICNKYNIKILASYLAGFPWSSDPEECSKKVDKEISNNLKQIHKLYKINPYIRPMFSLYLPYPSSTLFSKAQTLGIDLPQKLEDWSTFIIVAEDALNTRLWQKWIKKRQARLLLILNSYIFFFLDPLSWETYGNRIKNKLLKFISLFGFYVFKAFVLLRWKFNFFQLPVDFYIYNYLRKYSYKIFGI